MTTPPRPVPGLAKEPSPIRASPGPLVRAAEFVSQWWPSLLGGLGWILLVLAGLTDATEHVAVLPGHLSREVPFWLGLACVITGGLTTAVRQPRAAALSRRLDSLEGQVGAGRTAVQALRRKDLSLLAGQLGYFSSERITVFAFNGDVFVAIARHSDSPPFEAPGRVRYPLHEGCLGRAWDEGFAAVVDLPDPVQDAPAWQQALLDRLAIPLPTSAAMVMKSRTCVAFRIDTGGARAPIGVVVFESQLVPTQSYGLAPSAPRRRGGPVLEPEELSKIMKGTEGVRLQCMLECASEAQR